MSRPATFERNKIRVTAGDRAVSLVFGALVTLFALACLVPFVLVVSAAFTE